MGGLERRGDGVLALAQDSGELRRGERRELRGRQLVEGRQLVLAGGRAADGLLQLGRELLADRVEVLLEKWLVYMCVWMCG